MGEGFGVGENSFSKGLLRSGSFFLDAGECRINPGQLFVRRVGPEAQDGVGAL